MPNIKVAKLISGVEMIGDCGESGEANVVLMHSTFQVVIQQINETQFTYGLVAISAAAANAKNGVPVRLEASQIVGLYDPVDVLLTTYQRLTGKIIALPVRPLQVQ